MAQFDNLIIFPLIWSLIVFLFFYYLISIKITIPNFFETFKFREKQLNLSSEDTTSVFTVTLKH